MPDTNALHGKRILIVEDDFFIADAMQAGCIAAGLDVVGPVGRLVDAAHLLAEPMTVDGAMLDINLNDEWVFPLADKLTQRRVPFVFVTSYDGSILPERHRHVALWQKPVDVDEVLRSLFP